MNAVWNSYGQLCGCPEIFKKSCKFFCRVLDIRVPDVVDSDALDPSLFRAPLHLSVERALSDSEHPIMRPDAVEHFEIVLDFICQKLRHGDDAVAFLRFWSGNQVLTV